MQGGVRRSCVGTLATRLGVDTMEMYVMSYAKCEVEPSAVHVIISTCGAGEVWVYHKR